MIRHKVVAVPQNGERSGVFRFAVGAAVLAVVTAFVPAAANAASARPADAGAAAKPAPVFKGFKGAQTAAKKKQVTANTSGGSTGDGWQDILARGASDGELRVYGHSGVYQGADTYNSVTAINYGWGGFRFVGQGNLNGDGFADVVSIDNAGVLRVYPHSGSFNGTETLAPSVIAGYGWNINDRIYIADVNGDGLSDIVAKRADDNELFSYPNLGGVNGTSTFGAPEVFCGSDCGDIRSFWTAADVTNDHITDLVLVYDSGRMTMVNGAGSHETVTLGYGWDSLAELAETDINGDGLADILARRNDGTLVAYTHNGTYHATDPLATFNPPNPVGYGWNGNDVIT